MSRQKVLVTDDEATLRHALGRMLRGEDVEVFEAADGIEALEQFDEHKPDLMILDLQMPRMNGFKVCETIKSDPIKRLTPILVLTSSSSTENRLQVLELGADDFLAKPFCRVELQARVRSLLRIKGYIDELERAEAVLFALALSIEGKDPYTKGHCERLSLYGERLGERLGLPEEQINALRLAGIVHDIGKVAVPDAILLKPSRLTAEEFAVIQEHPVVGERICGSLKSFRHVLPIIRHHHEKLDGTGYPDGLAGDAIPYTARVLQIVDVFDALTTERPYKEAMSVEKALGIMEEEVGKGWWDAEIFAEFAALVRAEGFSLESAAREATVAD